MEELLTRTDVLGLLTEALEEEVSLEELKKTESVLIDGRDGLLSEIDEGSDLDLIIADLLGQFYDKIGALEDAAEEKIRARNLKQKEAVIENMRKLIQDEENIGKAFKELNTIKDRWNEIGDVPRAQYSRLQTEYSRLQETFFYNISIYKELADHDKRVNLKKKKELIEKVRKLESVKNIQTLDTDLKKIISEWDNVGGTFQKEWEVVKDEFWGAARKELNRIQKYYDNLRAKRTEALDKKKALIKQVQDISDKKREKHKEWQDSTEKVLNIQLEWKKIGFSASNETIWQEFRNVCDEFFDQKNAFYKDQKSIFNDRKNKKQELISKAAELSGQEDWKETADKIVELQKQWKEVGGASPRDENRLWKEFRGHCDAFFSARNKFYKSRDAEQIENLKKKEAIIEELNNMELTGDKGQDVQKLKDLASRWNEIGYVPFKNKEKLIKTYQGALTKLYDKVKLDKNERDSIRMENKVANLKGNESAIKKEKDHLRRQISRLKNDILQYENNLGFINDKTGNSPLVKEVQKKLNRDKDRIEELKKMMKMLSKA